MFEVFIIYIVLMFQPLSCETLRLDIYKFTHRQSGEFVNISQSYQSGRGSLIRKLKINKCL